MGTCVCVLLVRVLTKHTRTLKEYAYCDAYAYTYTTVFVYCNENRRIATVLSLKTHGIINNHTHNYMQVISPAFTCDCVPVCVCAGVCIICDST